ncbi:hypothetical protein P608_20310 [Comamonas thiooxydans]|uniref:Uncharacterized protein n=2 Tax=Comamonadaceae TaxID=80864 RepID=A0A0E3BQG0_9BURK|nr:hypothetical protein P609_20025 [Comamonas thiooxydans]KGH07371.1 hypothetical protein P608_20310 [Comamonas thiooxydans]KGH28118.1 hypothetical protein P606_03385 [Comamonas thiooxydans]KGH28459.1 hypothetical protein P607_02540 [Comamonas thiooxydans]
MVWAMLDENDDFRRPCTIGVQCPQSRQAGDVLAVTSGQVDAVRTSLFDDLPRFADGWQLADRILRYNVEITSIHVPEKRK